MGRKSKRNHGVLRPSLSDTTDYEFSLEGVFSYPDTTDRLNVSMTTRILCYPSVLHTEKPSQHTVAGLAKEYADTTINCIEVYK